MQTESFNQITSNEECVKYEDKFILADNLNQADEPKIMNNTTVSNEQYRCSVIVVQGALNMVINGISLRVKANEYLTVMPYTSIEIKSSRCKFICIKIEAYIIHDIFNTHTRLSAHEGRPAEPALQKHAHRHHQGSTVYLYFTQIHLYRQVTTNTTLPRE